MRSYTTGILYIHDKCFLVKKYIKIADFNILLSLKKNTVIFSGLWPNGFLGVYYPSAIFHALIQLYFLFYKLRTGPLRLFLLQVIEEIKQMKKIAYS